MSTPRCEIYALLVRGDDDAVGAFAYMLYKRHKREFMQNFEILHQRRPNDDELADGRA